MHAAGFLHRDIKPDNVYISADNGQPVLLDFGAARLMDRDTHTLVVSHGYAPPEQYQSRAPRTPSADLYAVGATIYRCMTGFPPPPADVRSEPGQSDPLIPPGVAAKQVYSPALIAALERTLRLAPADRPQSVAEFRAMLVPQYQSGDVHRLHKANSAVRPFRQWGMIATLAAIAIAFAVFVM